MIGCVSDLWLPFPGGAERLMFNLARDLHRRGEHVRTLTGYEHARQFDGPPVETAPIGIRDDHDAGWQIINQWINEHRPDVILTHHLYAYEFEPELIASGIPLVQVVLNGNRIEKAAMAIYISRWVAARAGAASDLDMVVTPPVFNDVVADTHGDYIGFIKPIEHKGVEFFYRIAAAMPDRQFVVLRGEWQTLEDIRPVANVTFMEPVDDISDFYAECRLVLVPSRSEDAGTVAQEAALNHIPCISSNVQGLLETNGGVKLDPHHLRSWLRAIDNLDDPTRYAAIVDQQLAHLAATDQNGRLDTFAARVAGLAAA